MESKLSVESRKQNGSSSSRRIRREGWVPGVINNEKGVSRMIRMQKHDLNVLLKEHVSENLILDISIDKGAAIKVLLKEVQHDPVTDDLLHADFVEISMTRKMRVRIPVVLIGTPYGVVTEGGILQQLLREVEVECLPGDLAETIECDVSGMKLRETIMVRNLKVSDKLKILTDAALALAAVVMPKEEEEAKPEEVAAAVEAAPAEPEVIGEKEREEKRLEKEKGKAPGDAAKGKEAAKAPAKTEPAHEKK
jgi:large subunit ribosomal protein L25